MTGIVLIVIITVLASSSSFISSAGKVADGRRRGLNTITRKGWITIALNASVIVISVIQYVQNEHEVERKELEAKRNQIVRDSVLKKNYDSALAEVKKKFDTTNIRTILSVTETLGKYGFKLDSASRQLVKVVKDSSKTTVILPNAPLLKISEIKLIEQKGGFNYYSVTFCSFDASSSFYQIDCHEMTYDSTSNSLSYGGILKFLTSKNSLGKDAKMTFFFRMNSNKVMPHTDVYLYTVGTYKNLDATKVYSVDEVYSYEIRTKTFGIISDGSREKIQKLVDENKNNRNILPSSKYF